GDRIGIEDVFATTDDGVRRLASVVGPELASRFPGGSTAGAAEPLTANYREFVVNPSGLVVVVVDLPNVIGPQSVLVPWEQLGDLVRPELLPVLRS
nr:hypothetical protein [Micromonospora sp. DSM 115978]